MQTQTFFLCVWFVWNAALWYCMNAHCYIYSWVFGKIIQFVPIYPCAVIIFLLYFLYFLSGLKHSCVFLKKTCEEGLQKSLLFDRQAGICTTCLIERLSDSNGIIYDNHEVTLRWSWHTIQSFHLPGFCFMKASMLPVIQPSVPNAGAPWWIWYVIAVDTGCYTSTPPATHINTHVSVCMSAHTMCCSLLRNMQRAASRIFHVFDEGLFSFHMSLSCPTCPL